MCKLTNIDVRNYRGIRSLQMDGLQRVNIVLGNNNSGKSSLLEAVLLLLGVNSPTLPIEMNFSRNYEHQNKEDLSLFFHDLNKESPILLHGKLEDGSVQKVEINYFEEAIHEVKAKEIKTGELTSTISYGLHFTQTGSGGNHSSRLVYNTLEKKINTEGSSASNTSKQAYYIAPRYNFNDFISHFNQIVADKEKSFVIEALGHIEPRITDVTVIGEKVMVDVGLPRLIPINLMGDGTRKLFTIVTALYQAKGNILVIDEIDNGLYYKSMKSLWKAVLEMSSKYDIQVFASTHSVDSLRALNTLLDEGQRERRDDVQIYTLRKDAEDAVTAYRFPFEKFNYLLDREEEIR